MKILSLDLGKFKSVCCIFDTKTRKCEFITVATDRHCLTIFLKKYKADLVVMVAS